MTAKYFCDVCTTAMDAAEFGRVKAGDGLRLKAEVIHFLDGVSNAGHVCHACIRKTLGCADRRRGAVMTLLQVVDEFAAELRDALDGTGSI